MYDVRQSEDSYSLLFSDWRTSYTVHRTQIHFIWIEENH